MTGLPSPTDLISQRPNPQFLNNPSKGGDKPPHILSYNYGRVRFTLDMNRTLADRIRRFSRCLLIFTPSLLILCLSSPFRPVKKNDPPDPKKPVPHRRYAQDSDRDPPQ